MELRDHDYVSNVRDAFFFFTSSFGQSENARTLGKGRLGRTARKDGSRVRRARMSGRRRATRRAATADADATAERTDATNDDAEAKTPERPARPTDDVRATTRRQTDGSRVSFSRAFFDVCLFATMTMWVADFQRRARRRRRADSPIENAVGNWVNIFSLHSCDSRLTTPDRHRTRARAGIRAPRVAFSVIRKRAEPDHASGGVPRGRVRAGVVPHGSSRERFRVALARSARVQFPGQVRRVAFVIRGRDEIRPPAPRIGFRAPIASPPGDRRLGSDFSCDSDLGVWVYVYMVYSYLVYTWDGFHARTVSNELTWNPRRARRETED